MRLSPMAVRWLAVALLALLLLSPAAPVSAEDELLGIPRLQIGFGEADQPQDQITALQVLVLLTILSLAPAIMILMTSFTRIVIVLGFVRTAMGTQQMPPNQVIMGLALFLTFFVMAPVFAQVSEQAVSPYVRGEIGQEEFFDQATAPLKRFMINQTRDRDLALFVNMTDLQPQDETDLPLHVVVPAFVISELKTAFQMGFVLFIPFMAIDMVVASTLMSMGMMMVPPIMISLPFKVLLFVMVDGWHLVVQSLVSSF